MEQSMQTKELTMSVEDLKQVSVAFVLRLLWIPLSSHYVYKGGFISCLPVHFVPRLFTKSCVQYLHVIFMM